MDGVADASGLQEEVVVGIIVGPVGGTGPYGKVLSQVGLDQ